MAAREPGARRWSSPVTWLVAAGTLLGTSLLAFPRKRALDPYSEAVGRGAPSAPPSRRAKALGFEPRDASARDLAIVMVVFAAGAAAMIGLMFVMLGILHARRTADAPPLTAEQQAVIQPPAPRLQSHPHLELQDLRAREEGLLHAYAWQDVAHQAARIPIERAMALAVGQSLDAGSPAGTEVGAPR